MSSRWSTLSVLAGALLLAGCTGDAEEETAAPSVTAQSAVAASPEDPLVTLTDPGSPEFLAQDVSTVLHEQGSGPQVFSLTRPENVRSIRFHVSCAPDAPFTVTMGSFFSGECGEQFAGSGAIPLPAGEVDLGVDLDLPAGVAYWIVGVPIP